MATLTILTGPKAGVYFELKDRPIVIGRETFCDIIISSRTVSRQHARVTPTANGWCIEDLGSVNGTFVNGERVNNVRQLRDRDRIRIYTVDLGYHLGPPGQGISVLGDTPSDTVYALPRDESDDSSSRILCAIDVRADRGASDEANAQQKLHALLEITESIRSSLDIDAILHRILAALFRIFPQASHGYILRSDSLGRCLAWATQHRHEGDHGADTLGPLGTEIVDRVISEQKAFLTQDADDDSRLTELRDSIHGDDRLCSAICAPLALRSLPPLGVIHLETEDRERPFSQQDLEVLASVALLAAQAVELAQVHESLVDYERRKHEMAMARQVQFRFLPSQRPAPPGYRFFDHYSPAGSVAGDYYDYIDLPDGRVVFAVGDVAGKGASAAMMMARLYGDVRYCMLTNSSPAEAMASLNRMWRHCVPDSVFFTLLLCVLDPKRHEITFARAGHPSPLLRSGATGRVSEVEPECGNLPIGAIADVVYDQAVISLAPGDLLLCYTDGVTDAMNPAEQVFGQGRLVTILQTGSSNAEELVQRLVRDVNEFVGGERHNDDICILAVERLP